MNVMGTRSSRSSAVFDIVTNDYNSEPMLLISNLAQVKQIHWVKIVLQGTKSDRNGLGGRPE